MKKDKQLNMTKLIVPFHSLRNVSNKKGVIKLRPPGGWGVFLEEVSCSCKRNRDILLGTWNIRDGRIILIWRGSWGLDGVGSG